MLKRISEKEIIDTYIKRYLQHINLKNRQSTAETSLLVANGILKAGVTAQLEADQKELEIIVHKIYEGIAYKATHAHGKGDSTLTISYPRLQALKEDILKKVRGEK